MANSCLRSGYAEAFYMQVFTAAAAPLRPVVVACPDGACRARFWPALCREIFLMVGKEGTCSGKF
jgi:hypothetical protein